MKIQKELSEIESSIEEIEIRIKIKNERKKKKIF